MTFKATQLQRWRRGAAALAVGLCCALPAIAQPEKPEKLPPYDVNGIKHATQWVPWVMAFGFAAIIILVAFKNPHRSHLD